MWCLMESVRNWPVARSPVARPLDTAGSRRILRWGAVGLGESVISSVFVGGLNPLPRTQCGGGTPQSLAEPKLDIRIKAAARTNGTVLKLSLVLAVLTLGHAPFRMLAANS